jgi:threonine dehydrogenase-like Zn-dependent dehydrogenase
VGLTVVDAVGTEAHVGGSVDSILDRAKVAMLLGTDRAHVLREAILCCRKGGTVSVQGVYVGSLDEAPAAYKTFRDKKDWCIKVVIKN